MEVYSILGPFFRMTTIPSFTISEKQFFPEPLTEDNKEAAILDLRKKVKISQKYCHQYLLTLLESNEENKEKIFSWIATTLNRNRDRLKMNVDRISICGDGFLINLADVLLQLSVHYLDSRNTKEIDPDYLQKYDRIRLPNDVTRLNMESSHLRSYTTNIRSSAGITEEPTDIQSSFLPEKEKKISRPNFFTECFFLTLQALHLGLTKLFGVFDRPVGLDYDSIRTRALFEVQLLDPDLVLLTFKFYSLFARFLVQTALEGGGEVPTTLPLPDPPSKSLLSMPEYFVEDFVDFISFLFTHYHQHLPSLPLEDIMTFMVTFITSPNTIKNPHLRGLLIYLLSLLAPKNLKTKLPQDPFENKLACQFLVTALIQYYIDIEITGASTQFYDKFNGRYYVAQVMRHIWHLSSYRQSFQMVLLDTELFLRFSNMLMNDSIFLLDESFGKLQKIHENELLFESPQWARLGLTRQQERQAENGQLERMVRTYLLLSWETVRMIHYITVDMSSFFMRPELVDRLAAMLNYFLSQLIGPKEKELAVRNPEKYNFHPKWLLKKIASIYLNFFKYDEFAAAVVRDGRSYSPALFQAALTSLQQIPSFTPDILSKFEKFVALVDAKAKEANREQEMLGDIPDEFLDPILQTLMTDPVILPTSNVTMDRATITRHLLSTPSDPFNREQLSVDQLIPDLQLKEKIDKWRKNKRQ